MPNNFPSPDAEAPGYCRLSPRDKAQNHSARTRPQISSRGLPSLRPIIAPMPQEILSVAIWDPIPGHEAASLETIRELFSILAAKGYSRDLLYRDGESHYVLLRHWKS